MNLYTSTLKLTPAGERLLRIAYQFDTGNQVDRRTLEYPLNHCLPVEVAVNGVHTNGMQLPRGIGGIKAAAAKLETAGLVSLSWSKTNCHVLVLTEAGRAQAANLSQKAIAENCHIELPSI